MSLQNIPSRFNTRVPCVFRTKNIVQLGKWKTKTNVPKINYKKKKYKNKSVVKKFLKASKKKIIFKSGIHQKALAILSIKKNRLTNSGMGDQSKNKPPEHFNVRVKRQCLRCSSGHTPFLCPVWHSESDISHTPAVGDRHELVSPF